MADYTAKRIDDMQAGFGGGFVRARAELGVSSFGMQVIRMPPEFDGYPEHDHLYCQTCRKMIEFQSAELERLLREVCRQHQFQFQGHSFVIRGTCAECNRARTVNRRLDLV